MLFRHFAKEQLRTALVPSLALMLSSKIILINSTGKKDTLILFSFAFYYRWIQFIFIGPSHFFFLLIHLAVLGLSCDMWPLSCRMWDLPSPEEEPQSSALGTRNLGHWTTRWVLCWPYLFLLFWLTCPFFYLAIYPFLTDF